MVYWHVERMETTLAARPYTSAHSARSERMVRAGWLLLLVLSLSLYLIRQIYDGPFGKDFTIFLTGAHLLTDGHAANLYSVSAQATIQQTIGGSVKYPGGLLPFNYPPYVAALFVPFTFVPPNVAYYIWVGIQWVILGAWAAWVVSSLHGWGRGASNLLVMAMFSFAPILEALLMGQMSLVAVVLWWWAFVSWRNERWGQLGVAVALAAFKPQMAVLLLVGLAAQKRWRALAFAALAESVLWGAAILLAGPGIVTSYIDMLRLSASTTGTLGFYPGAMPNLRGLLTITGLSPDMTFWAAMLGWLLSIIAAFFIWLRPVRGSGQLAANFGLTVVLAALFSPHLYVHDASLLIIAIICAYIARPQGFVLGVRGLFIPIALVFVGMYMLVLGVPRSYIPLILSVWLLCCTLFLMNLRASASPR